MAKGRLSEINRILEDAINKYENGEIFLNDLKNIIDTAVLAKRNLQLSLNIENDKNLDELIDKAKKLYETYKKIKDLI